MSYIESLMVELIPPQLTIGEANMYAGDDNDEALAPISGDEYEREDTFFGDNGNPDQMDYDLGLCGQE